MHEEYEHQNEEQYDHEHDHEHEYKQQNKHKHKHKYKSKHKHKHKNKNHFNKIINKYISDSNKDLPITDTDSLTTPSSYTPSSYTNDEIEKINKIQSKLRNVTFDTDLDRYIDDIIDALFELRNLHNISVISGYIKDIIKNCKDGEGFEIFGTDDTENLVNYRKCGNLLMGTCTSLDEQKCVKMGSWWKFW